MEHSRVTIDQLHTIRRGEPLILEERVRKTMNIPMLWLFYDFDTSSYILVRRAYDSKKARSFNHVIIDDIFFEDNVEQFPEIINQAVEKIKDGECLVFNSDNIFTVAECNKPHK